MKNRKIVKQDLSVATIKQIANSFTSIVSERSVLEYEKTILHHLSSLRKVSELQMDLNIGHSDKTHAITVNFTLVSLLSLFSL